MAVRKTRKSPSLTTSPSPSPRKSRTSTKSTELVSLPAKKSTRVNKSPLKPSPGEIKKSPRKPKSAKISKAAVVKQAQTNKTEKVASEKGIFGNIADFISSIFGL